MCTPSALTRFCCPQIMCLGASSDEASSEEAFDPTAEHITAMSDGFDDFSD